MMSTMMMVSSMMKIKKMTPITTMLIMMTEMIKEIQSMNVEPMISNWMSATMISLTMWMTSIIMNESKQKKLKTIIWITSTSLTILFQTWDMMSMYFVFESTLAPMMMTITIWGTNKNRYKAMMFMTMYTLSSANPLIASILQTKKKSCLSFLNWQETMKESTLIQLTMIILFAMKAPLFMLHSWLLKAHLEAPVSGSMILASLLLKMGGFGMIKLMSITYIEEKIKSTIITVGMVGSVIMSKECMSSILMKSIVAQSSVMHMSITTVAIMTSTKEGIEGAMMSMVAHGLTSSAMFMMTNYMYIRSKSRVIEMNSGVIMLSVPMMVLMMLVLMANMAAPMSLSLPSEIMMNYAIMMFSPIMIPLMGMSMILSTGFNMKMFNIMLLGKMKNINKPLSMKEISMMIMHIMPLNMLTISVIYN